MARYIVSDLHLDHANIISYCDRPFTDVTAMNETLIERWNETIGPDDRVFFLGDLCLGRTEADITDWLEQLTYRSLVFVEGNHDPVDATLDSTLPTRQYHYLTHDDWQFCLTHRPERVPRDWQGWVIHGHTHNNELAEYPFVDPEAKTVNVSAELLDYTPLALNTLVDIISADQRYETIADWRAE